MNFTDKTVVITGGANGIGKCMAEEFQKAGARVAVRTAVLSMERISQSTAG